MSQKLKTPRIPKLGKKTYSKSGIWVIVITAVFVALGATFLIIGYQDTILEWMRYTGVAFVVIAVIPFLVIVYNQIQKKIES